MRKYKQMVPVIKKKLEPIINKKRQEGSKDISDLMTILDNLLQPQDGNIAKITGEEYDELVDWMKITINTPVAINNKTFANMIKNEIKVCLELGCKIDAENIYIYNPETKKKVEIESVYNSTSRREIRNKLEILKH